MNRYNKPVQQRGRMPERTDVPAGMTYAMAYVRYQHFEGLYPIDEAICKGTLFIALDMPYTGKAGRYTK